MENVLLKNAAIVSIPADTSNSPLSFLEWKQRVQSIPDEDLSFHYNQYILNWFNTHQNQPVSQKFILRQKYLYLLQQLQTFFTEEEKNSWYNQINFASEKELLLAIPYFAKKLRDVAIYYLDLRKRLKYTKLKYNRVGTKTALEHEIYSYLLNALNPSKKEFMPQLLSAFPAFESMQQSLVVTVDELYDDNQYFDRSPTAPLSSYVNVLDQATASYFQTKGIVLSSDNWIFDSFNFSTSADINSFVNRLTGNVFEQTDVNLYGSFIQEFLAENKYSLTLQSPLTSYYVSNFTISAGNNTFYFPEGIVDPTLTLATQLAPVALSSLSFSGASSGLTLSAADTIFVKSGNNTKGAWYRYIDYDLEDSEMVAHLAHNETTTFIFPYPGYGLSAIDAPWTGPSTSFNEEYPYLTPSLKAAVQSSYWNSSLSSNSCLDVWLNNTTLAEAGAAPSKNYSSADKIYLRPRDLSFNTNNPHGELSGAWLYTFTETAIPVSTLQQTTILWPYDVLDTSVTTLSTALQNFNFTGICKSTPLQDLDTSHFIAGSSIDTSDVIYKLRYFTDDTLDAIECAWLSGGVTLNGDYEYTSQDGLNMYLAPGSITRFLWTGADNTPLSSVFTYVNHQEDCPLATNKSLDWNECTCKQTYYSPFGHGGNSFLEFNTQSDFIALDTTNFGSMDLGSWRGLDNEPANTSTSFAWYSTINNSFSSTWGYGNWTSVSPVPITNPTTKETVYNPSSSTLRLNTGKSYFYGRTNARLVSADFPPYIVLNKFNTKRNSWIEGQLNADKSAWISTDRPSQFVLNPGDYLTFNKQASTTHFYLSAQPNTIVSTNLGSIWASYDSIALSDNPLLNSTIISWPNYSDNIPNNQLPSLSLPQIFTSSQINGSQYPYLATYFPTSAYTAPGPYSTTITSIGQTVSAEFVYSTQNEATYFVVPPNVTTIYFELVGGGGGGGSSVSVLPNSYGGSGGGGGAGELIQGTIPVTPGDILYLTLGQGGAGSNNTPYSSSTILLNSIAKSANGSNGSPTILSTSTGSYQAAGGFGGGGAWTTASSSNPDGIVGFAGPGGLKGDSYPSGKSGVTITPKTVFPVYGGAGGTISTPTYNFSNPLVGSGGTGAEANAGVYADGENGNGGGIILRYTTPTITQTNTPTVYITNTPTPTYTLSASNNIGGILAWNVVNVQTSAAQTFYNQDSITFTPTITGTYYIEVTAQTGTGEQIYIYGKSSPRYGTGELTLIPDLTAVPGIYYSPYTIPFNVPAAGFVIEQPLEGWSYASNSVQQYPYDISVGARPYWAQIYKDKDTSTNYKGVQSWGNSNEYVDGYIPHRIPRLSPLALTYNTTIQYERNGPSIWWTQPFTLQTYNGSSQWCVLSSYSGVSNLSSVYASEHPLYYHKLLTFATTTPSDIVLTNNIDGTSVTVDYYALNNFTWNVSSLSATTNVAAVSSLYYQAQLPSGYISNRFYPSIATVPTLEKVYSIQDVGGYFTPQHLGASQFINANYTVTLETSSLSSNYNTFIVEDISKHVGGRGLTKQDQPTFFSWTENNLWMKEPSTAGKLAGLVKKSLTKTNQVFVPYQPNNQEKPVGLVDANSRTTPWGGPNSDIWTDVNNHPQSFTGVNNLSAWTQTQVLKQSGKSLDGWVSDIYGNQYGLYKDLTNVTIADRLTTPGELWTRTNNGLVLPGHQSLSSVYSFVDSTYYAELTGNILSIDCFSDILMIQTPSILLFAKISYDYNTTFISSVFDNARGFYSFPLENVLSDTMRFEQTWYFTQQKQVITLITRKQDQTFIPTLYSLDLNTLEFTQVFPILSADYVNLNSSLGGLGNNITNGTLTYNSELKTYLVTYTGLDAIYEPYFVNIEITNWDLPTIRSIDIYKNTSSRSELHSSPLIIDVNDTLSVGTSANVSFNRIVPVLYFPEGSTVKVLNSNNVVAVIDGTNVIFTGKFAKAGVYQVEFELTNTTGTTTYSLCVAVISR